MYFSKGCFNLKFKNVISNGSHSQEESLMAQQQHDETTMTQHTQTHYGRARNRSPF